MLGSRFKHVLLICGASPLALLAATTAAAQTTDTPEPAEVSAEPQIDQEGEIVVTGFRASLGSALNAKRSETSAVDVIKAEDIADFPDNNLAESLQRVPGVSINRAGGEGRAITVRGLSGSFTRVRINGMEAQAISSATTSDRGTNTGRGFDFNVFASELFNNLVVRKTADAETIEGSLGATVDLNVARPFDYKDFTLALGAQAGYNTLAKNIDPKFSGLVSNTWDTGIGRIGVLASAAFTRRNYYEDQFGSGGWNPATQDGGFCTPVGAAVPSPALNPAQGTTLTNCATGVPRPAAGDTNYALVNRSTVFLPRLPRYGRFHHEQERLGVTGSVQWEPAPGIQIGGDVLYSDFKAFREENWLEGFSFARAIASPNFGKPQTAIREAILRNAGTSNTQGANFGQTVYDIDYGVFDGVDVRSDTQYDRFRSRFTQYSLYGKFDLTDRLKLNVLAGKSSTNFDQTEQTTFLFGRNNTRQTIDFRDDRNMPTIGFGFDVTDPSQFTLAPGSAEIRAAPSFVDNVNKMVEGNFVWKATEGFTLKGGVHYDRFNFSITPYQRPNNFTVPTVSAADLAGMTHLVEGFGKGMREGVFPTSWVAINYKQFAERYGLDDYTGDFALIQNLGGTRRVQEDVVSAFGQVDFDLSSAGAPIRGNVGMRYAKTTLDSTGYSPAIAQFVTVENSYEDWLPSLNVVADLTPNLLIRGAVAKVITRPELGFLSPGANIVFSGTPNINSGNPLLEPIRATTYDAAIEWYFTRNSLLSAAYFRKDIQSYIQNQALQQTFNQTGLPASLFDPNSGLDPNVSVFTVNQARNTPGGPLEGYEINYQHSLTFLPGFLKNLGVLANYTHVKSTITYFLAASSANTTSRDLLGLSRDAFNGTVYYEDSKLSARISGSYRGPYIIALPANNPLQDLEGVDKSLIFDLSLSYQLTDKIKLSFEGLNIFDRAYRQYIDSDRDSTFVYSHTGAQFYLGAQFRF
ncbi:TonB-dependent receptor [Sphingomonas sp. HF-S4]|uniref:TonB-dependent receptor n=1 Tax=Sphingomonas agrestis TaxID=3080540 RepID=A0ABU3Y6I9_9SPHN|nr:TonB-dependent receptor [Sphingomonas sp. HF-S4]MDV3457021.1 TonB-dependent receptor [Sphingomonas sp. HF-S4]